MIIHEKMNEPAVQSATGLLTAWIEATMAYRGQPGLSLALVYDQEVVWARGFGKRDVARNLSADEHSLYRIASITKLFTATAIMILRDAGKLQLDDDIRQVLPWFKLDTGDEEQPLITIRNLLTHTSGLPREAAFPYWSDNDFPEWQKVMDALPTQKPALPVYNKWKYSNLALSLAGEIVAAVSGQPYTTFVEQNVLQPLGMVDTFVQNIDPEHQKLAVGYGRRLPDGTRTIAPYSDLKGISPAASMATSVLDLARFAMLQHQAHTRESRILKPATLREMHRVQWMEPDWTAGWGIGFGLAKMKDKVLIGHGGALQGYRTQLFSDPVEKFAAVVFTNADDGFPIIYQEKIFEWVAPEVLKVFKPKEDAKAVQESWQKFTGRYRNTWGDMQILIYKGELVGMDVSAPDPILTMTRMIPVAENVFKMDAKYGHGGIGELAVFELDADGKVARVRTGDNYSYRIEEW